MLLCQLIVADRAAQRVVSLPDFSLFATADLPGAVCLNFTKTAVNRFFRLSVKEVLVAIFGGVCELVFGSTFALQSYPQYLEFFRSYAVPCHQWVPDCFHAPIDQESPAGPPPTGRWPFLQVSWGSVSCIPSSFSRPALPWGCVGNLHSPRRLSTALCPSHLLPFEALSTGRCASRRRPPTVAALGSSLQDKFLWC